MVEGAFSQQTLTELLKEYKQASDYAQKTRIESLGHVLVFTREDIERMQAFTLADLLQYLKVGWVVPNRFGVENFSFQGTSTGVSTFVRLYINDHEVSSVHTGSPFLTYDNYPLDHIDHVEVYYASGAIRLGDEPASVIIKLYTKKPERENATTFRGTVSNKMDYDNTFIDAREIKSQISYLVMVNKGYLNYENQFINGQPIYRNLWKNFAYFGFNYYKTFIEFSFARITRNIFQGLSLDAAPEEGKTKSLEYYISLTHYFLNDRSLKVNLTLDGQHRKYYEKNREGILIPRVIDIKDPTTIPVEYDENVKLYKYTLNVTKEFKTKDNLLLTGFTVKDKHYNVDDRSYKTLTVYKENIRFIDFDRETLTSLILEDQYNITDKNLVIFSLRADKYFRKNKKDISDYMAKLGFISFLSDRYMVKTYIGRSYFPPTFLDFELSKEDLKQSRTKSALIELVYKKDGNKLSVFAGYEKVEDPVIPDYKKGYLVNGKDYEYSLVALEYNYRQNNNLNLSIGYSKTFSTIEPSLLSEETGYFRITGEKDKINFYSELVYKKGFKVSSVDIPDSYNLNAGISYLINENFSLKIKGINILNRGAKIPVIPVIGNEGSYDSLDRKYFISLEVSY
ncbi:TonB-dependent receptor plug domain protein [Persephonella marina EX-H1]|uniref:TonB-dependent receptor plug domain protein n=2 Tax=Hydrogenothermaceae TaxID=224027 RepID=C0QUK2_PERMH|nr:TonB-dependent receptor plug domain protein [Persephonella marina EX-H1]